MSQAADETQKYSMKLLDDQLPNMAFWTIRNLVGKDGRATPFYSVSDIFTWMYSYYVQEEEREKWVRHSFLSPKMHFKIVPTDSLIWAAGTRTGLKILCVHYDYITTVILHMNQRFQLEDIKQDLDKELKTLLDELHQRTGYIPIEALRIHKTSQDRLSYLRRLEDPEKAAKIRESERRTREKVSLKRKLCRLSQMTSASDTDYESVNE